MDDLMRADINEYIFLKSTNKICVNTKEIKLKTAFNEYIIPMNSIIYFNNDYIALYKIKNDEFSYQRISDVDDNSEISISDVTLNYNDLLINLGLKKRPIENVNFESEEQEEPKKEETIVIEEDVEEEKTEEKEIEYIDPKVTLDTFTENVYYTSSVLNIYDPSGAITSPVEITITKNGQKYLLKSYRSSGNIEIRGLAPDDEYEITAKYTYLDIEGKKRVRQFYTQTIKTKSFESLNSITLDFKNGNIYKDKIEIADLCFENDLKDEVFKGLKSGELVINNVSYRIPIAYLNAMLKGEKVTFQTSETLLSNSKYSYEIFLYDLVGNKFKLNNSKGNTVTAKADPRVNIQTSKKDLTQVGVTLSLINTDNVTMSGYRYELTTLTGEVVESGNLEIKDRVDLIFESLSPLQNYIITIYANYDLGDGNGIYKDQIIGQGDFITATIGTLGKLYLNTEMVELTYQNAKIKLKINTDITDNRLVKIISQATLLLREQDVNGNVLEGGKTFSIYLNDEQLSNFKKGEEIEVNFEGLDSSTKYQFNVNTTVVQGTYTEVVGGRHSIEPFKTMKKPAKVNIKNLFVTGNIIDFDINIEDPDIAVLQNNVRLELKDKDDKLVDLVTVNTNEDFIRLSYDKLNENQTYRLYVYADEYNEGHDYNTYYNNYLLFEKNIVTISGLEGKIDLANLLRKPLGKNLIDAKSKVKWYSTTFNTTTLCYKQYSEEEGILRLHNSTIGNYSQVYTYDLRDYIGKTVTISFLAKMTTTAGTSMYFENKKIPTTSGTKIPVNSTNWQRFGYTVTVNDSGYLGFYIASNNNNPVQIKELQVEIGDDRTDYEEFIYDLDATFEINLIDGNNEIDTNDYYLLLYKDGELISTNRYEEIGSSNMVVDSIKDFILDENADYKAELAIKSNERFNVLDTVSFRTDDEIVGIKTREEFLEIQPEGHYFVLRDIDLTGLTDTTLHYSNNIQFNGDVNFQGNTLSRDRSSNYAIFQYIGTEGIIENLVYDISINNPVETSDFNGFVVYNYGTIRGIIINLVESNELPNISYRLLGYSCPGVLENFIIHLQDTFYAQQSITAGFSEVSGTIRNGYVYGTNMRVKYPNNNSAPVALSVNRYGTIENVFSLAGVDGDNPGNDYTANVVGRISYGTAKNIYSVGSSNTITLGRGPTIGYLDGYTTVTNSHYFDDRNFNNGCNKKASYTTLYDVKYQNEMLNSYNQFIVDDLVNRGYFPQLILDESMPNQEYLELPKLTEEDYVDVTSSRLIEQTSYTSAKIEISVYNPAGEEITGFTIKDINDSDVKILSQEFKEGKSDVLVEIKNPIRSLSKYSIMSITSKGVLGIHSTRKYTENEKVFYVDFFREINSLEDWKKIPKSPTENYLLMTDLDFINEGTDVLINTTYTGKLNGNNKTIKNIRVPGNYRGFFAALTGTIQNLNIENYTHTDVKDNLENGFIGIANSPSIIENVHIKNIEMNGMRNSGELYIGGLVGRTYNTIIRNCGVSDFKFHIDNKDLTLIFGGLVGYGNYTNMSNCFVQDVDMESINIGKFTGIGGLIGYEQNGLSAVNNCYTTGRLYTNDGYQIGGIVGTGSNVLNRCYSTVDIFGVSTVNIGGIKGNGSNTNNCLFLGDIYLDNIKTVTRRINGTSDSTNCYGFVDQYFNGVSREDKSGTAGLLTYEELTNKSTYLNTIKFDNSYSYEQIAEGILPKLYYTDNKTLLPNQKDNILIAKKQREFVIQPIDYNTQVNKTPYNATVQLVIDNPNNLEISGIEIDSLEILEQKAVTRNHQTAINLSIKPKKFYDTYMITKINYTDENGEQKQYDVCYLLQLQFFKEIRNVDEWQNIDPLSSENYRLMDDIDFEGVTPNYNLRIGRLESESGQKYTMRNLKIDLPNQYDCFIKSALYSMKSINFEDIEITSGSSQNALVGFIRELGGNDVGISDISFKRVKYTAETGSYKSFFDIINTSLKDISLEDIEFDMPNCDSVGPIRYISYNTENVTLNHIRCTGKSYVGGFTANNVATIKNVTGKDIIINATGNDAGAVNGGGGTITVATIDDVHVTGVNYVGGISGDGTVTASTVTDSDVTATNNYAGGIAGLHGDQNVSATDCVITAKNYAGGISGNGDRNMSNCFVTRCKISGESYLGGISGYLSASAWNCGVIDSSVTGTGSNIGGITGSIDNSGRYTESNPAIKSSFAKNTPVVGDKNVAGIAGRMVRGAIAHSYSDSNVTATTENAAGILGYLDNTNNTAIDWISGIYKNYIAGATITAPTNVGATIGDTAIELYENRYGGNYFDVQLNNDLSNENITFGVGAKKDQDSKLTNTYFSKYSKINNEYVNSNNTDFDMSHALDRTQLENKDTYINNMQWSETYYDFSSLEDGKYPFAKSTNNQTGINLPTDVATTSLNNANSNKELFTTYKGLKIPISRLPEVKAYAVDVDKINLEFSEASANTYFNYKVGDKLSNNIAIDNKIFTFKYDFVSDVEITISDGINKKTVKIVPEDVKNDVLNYKEEYYYLMGKKLCSNINNIAGDYVNLFNGKVLEENGNIYSLDTLESMEKVEKNTFDYIGEKYSLQSFNYQGNKVDTYMLFTNMIINDEVIERDFVTFLKNDRLYLFDNTLDILPGKVIVDSYNNNEYQTILSSDGRLYDLKTKLNYPNDFKNSDIKNITSNLESNSQNIIVYYESGRIYVFNYITGEVVYDNKVKENISFVNYLLKSIGNNYATIDKDLNEKYDNTKKLVDKLEETPINDAALDLGVLDEVYLQNTDSKQSSLSNKYLTVYDNVNKKYVIYNENDLFEAPQEELKTEDWKIDNNEELSNYYESANKQKANNNTSGYALTFASIAGALVILVVLVRKNR